MTTQKNADTDGLVIFINHPAPVHTKKGENNMEDVREAKTATIERFMRDQLNKAESLYNKGYNDGYAQGYRIGRDISEASESIKVGDEVIDPNGLKAIVTNTDTHFHLLYPDNGKTWKAPKTTVLEKTGERIDMEFPRW